MIVREHFNPEPVEPGVARIVLASLGHRAGFVVVVSSIIKGHGLARDLGFCVETADEDGVCGVILDLAQNEEE